jgi:hypothetical protein
VYLKAFPRLKKVSLFDTQITDAGVEHLEALTQLETILVEKTKITEAGRQRLLAKNPKLKFGE